MQRTFPVARLKAAILFIALFAILATGDKAISQQEAGPEPVASSVSINTAVSPAAADEVGETHQAQANSFLYLPTILDPSSLSEFAQQVVDITNEERSKAGCGPVSVSLQLSAAAQGHSEDMALNDFFSHTGSNGSQFWERVDATGYQYSSAGENIAAGYPTAEDVMGGWMGSDGHRANILNCDHREIGVGYYLLENDTGAVNFSYYWTQVLARPR
ncbi:MAG TPA: CAP domain-containing protein [Anaerolineae bacterium]